MVEKMRNLHAQQFINMLEFGDSAVQAGDILGGNRQDLGILA